MLTTALGGGLLVGATGWALAAAGVSCGKAAIAAGKLGFGSCVLATGSDFGGSGACATAVRRWMTGVLEMGGLPDGVGAVAVAALTEGAAAAPEAGEVMTGALVTSAWAAIDVLSSSDPGRATKETTTTAPAVAPIAVATSAMRAVRIKPGAGAR